MSELRNLQLSFMDYLLGSPSTIVQNIQSSKSFSAENRLGIYSYAYMARLKEALLTDYEKLHGYLGDEQFNQVMERYIEKYPSQQTNLRYYSAEMASLLREEEPFKQLPMLAELASIETSFANSFDAEDSSLVNIEDLITLPPEAWGTLRLDLQPSVQILSLKLNSFAVWKALAAESEPPKTKNYDKLDTWLLWRDAELITRYRPLPAAEAVALSLALQKKFFANICEQLLEHFSEEDTPVKAVSFLQTWIQEGLVANLDYQTTESLVIEKALL